MELRRQDIKAGTITSYISHVNEFLSVRGIAVSLRSDLAGVFLQCAKRQDRSVAPLRLTQKIPISAPVLLLIFVDITRHSKDIRSRDECLACCAVAYGLCCRIHEVLPDRKTRDLDGLPIPDHSIMTAHLSFTFPGDHRVYPASRPDDFPPGTIPSSFTGFHDSLKNMPGGSGTRAVAANPHIFPFCLVRIVYHYVCTYRPPATGHLFPTVKSSGVSVHIKRALNSVGLDGSRGCPHAMRVGSETMVQALRYSRKGLTAEQEQHHGMWRSAQGLQPYARASMLTGSETSFALYDMLYMTIEYLKWFYMSPAIPVAIDSP